MLKKLLAALMCITMATSFVACGDEEKKEEKDSSSEIVTEAEEETEDPEKAAAEIEEAEKAVEELEKAAEEDAAAEKEEAVESLIEDIVDTQSEAAENKPAENNDTIGLVDILTSGDWSVSSIAMTGMEEMSFDDYCTLSGSDPAQMQTVFTFSADGTVITTSNGAEDAGTYVVDGENIYMTDSTNTTLTLTYDEASGMILFDLVGTGEMVMKFAVGQ